MPEGQADAVVETLRANDRKGVTPQHLFMQVLSMGGHLGGGAFLQAMETAGKRSGAVYHYFVTYDAPLPGAPGFCYAWHTADLPLQMRVVLHPESEQISRTMAHSWAAFIRTGDPATAELPWPAFTPEERLTMVLDEECRVERNPAKPYRDALH